MTPVFLSIKGLRALQRKLKKINSGLSHRKKLNARAVVIVDRWIQKNFQNQGRLAYPGQGWQPLHPATVVSRRKGGAGAKILQDTGHMRSRWKKDWTNRFAKIQSGVPYSATHDKGLGHVPERKILPTPAQITPELIKVYGDYIKDLIR